MAIHPVLKPKIAIRVIGGPSRNHGHALMQGPGVQQLVERNCKFRTVERWDLPKSQHGQQLVLLEPNFMTVCHYLSTPPALQRCAGENSTLYMFPPPMPEAKSSEVETTEM